MKNTLDTLISKGKYFALASATALAIAMPSYGQNKVSGNVESVPFKVGLDSAEVVLTNTSTKKQYAALTDSFGNFTLNVPNGQYNKKVIAKNYFLYNDSMLTPTTVSGNVSGMNIQLVENLDITEKNYYNNILEEVVNLAGAPYGKSWNGWTTSKLFSWKDSLRPIKLYPDSTDAASGWAAQADSAISELSGPKTLGNVQWNIQPTSATSSVEIKYVPNNQMPTDGQSSAGWTDMTYDSNNDFKHAICYINTTVGNSVDNVRITIRRELERSLGLQSASPDPNSDMDENGADYTDTLRHDDGLVLAVRYSLNNHTFIAPYIDSVVSSIDLPPGSPVNVSPASGDTLRPSMVFSWNAKPGSKPTSYVFSLFGTGQRFTRATSDTSLTLDSVLIDSLKSFSKYSWTVAASDNFYPAQLGDTSDVYTSEITAVKEQSNNVPKDFVLEQNYPNPFNPTTTIEYQLPKPARVRLDVYNVLGQRVRSVDEGMQSPGTYHELINGSDLPSGVYLYQITAESDGKTWTKIKKMIALK